MSKKKTPKCCLCTPNCVYFPQEVRGSNVLSEKIIEGGVKVREVRRECLYDNSQIKSWAHICGRKVPCYITPPKVEEQVNV